MIDAKADYAHHNPAEVIAAEDAHFAFEASRLGDDRCEEVTAKNLIASRAIKAVKSAVGRKSKYEE